MPCARNSAPPSFLCFRLEHVDEQFADGLALDFGVLDAGKRVEKRIGRVHMDQRNVVGAAEQRQNLLGFAKPQQPVIDEHAGELIADGFVDQDRGNGGIDAAGKPADHPGLADLAADFLDRLVLEGAHGPVAGTARDVAHEIAQDGGAVRRVHDFEMELGGVEFALVVGDHGDRRIGRGADGGKSLRRLGDPVAMAHPDRIALADLPDAVGERRRYRQLDLGAAELAVMAGLDLAAELMRHGLLAVADAEHRQAGLVDRHRGKRRVRRRAPRPGRRRG